MDECNLSSDVEVDGPLNQHQTHSEQGGKLTATLFPVHGSQLQRQNERGIKNLGDVSKRKDYINSYIYMFPRPQRK